MPRTEIERTVLPSLLDRLTDEDPRTSADAPVSREESVRRYRESVLRDVEWLLNTRRTAQPGLASFVELRRSAFAYGLPDTTGAAPTTAAARERLVRWVEETVAAFEPRLTHVRVVLGTADQARSPQLHFTLSAMLRMDPAPEHVVFDTVHDTATGGYALHERAHERASEGARA